MYQKHEQAGTSRGTSICSNSNRFRSRSYKTKLECVASLFEGPPPMAAAPHLSGVDIPIIVHYP